MEQLIKERIAERGPISVAEYMALALSHPEHGYYMKKDPLGADGDFITAPEISQMFGEMIGAWLAAQWLAQGRPKAALVELGPGRGTLMSDALRATRNVPGFHEAISVHLVETSPALKAKQWEALAGKHPRIEWHDGLGALPAMPWLLVANEFFDALPIRQFVGDKERMVGVDARGELCFIPPQGEIYERCEAGEDIARTIGGHVASHGGAALVVDYGYAQGKGDTLQAVKNHERHEPLHSPGEADLTAHVDFAALAKAAESGGAKAHGPVSQGKFLAALGIAARAAALSRNATPAQKTSVLAALERLTSPDQMGDLFKTLCILPKQHPTPEGF